MKETDIWQLMAKVLSAEADDEEQRLLKDILQEDTAMQQTFLYLQNLKMDVDQTLLSEGEIKQRENKGLLRIEKMLSFEGPATKKETSTSFIGKYKRWLVAASLLFMVGLASLFFISRKQLLQPATPPAPVIETFVATKAISIELDDGTKVWLNKGSTLKCHREFNRENREVFLKGEAFFDVAQHAARPFIVHLKKGIDVKVLGTRFNVKAYPNTPFIEASLLSGKIALDLNEKGKQNLLLSPQEKITINLDQLHPALTTNHFDTITVQKVQLKPNPIDQQLSETAWMEDRLSFYNMSFEELAYELERYYGKKFILKDRQLKDWHLTGSFKNETLNQVLDALQITTPFNYKISDDKVILYSN